MALFLFLKFFHIFNNCTLFLNYQYTVFGGVFMNLKNNNITVGELLSNPKSKAILTQEFPEYVNHPLVNFVSYMPLKKVLDYSKGKVSQDKIIKTLEKLKKI